MFSAANTYLCNQSLPARPYSWAPKQLIYPLMALLIFSITSEVYSLDMQLADFIYQREGHQWLLKNSVITSQILHKGGRTFSLSLLFGFIALWLASYRFTTARKWRETLIFIICAASVSSLLVMLGKELTNISCPWDFSRYGGDLVYQSLFSQLIHRNGNSCFPAGHASGGYGWLALYFAGLYHHSKWRWFGLIFALTLGALFGITQQLRGAHFISHDIWTLTICWTTSFCFYRFWLHFSSAKDIVKNLLRTTKEHTH